MLFFNLADRSPHWFIFLTFTSGRGWAYGPWQWITAFDALTASTNPGPDVQEMIVYWWDGSTVSRAFT